MKAKFLLLVLVVLSSFFACIENQANSEAVPIDDVTAEQYSKKGKQIATQTFAVLSSNLQKALAAGGVSNAIQYCTLAAMPLVDSLSQEYNATIRRTSLKVRNAENEPDSLEDLVLKEFAAKVEAGEDLEPILKSKKSNTISFFAPIKINAFCLQCHGKLGENLSLENYALINKSYPGDQAIGYKAGELRGIWSIEFLNK